jgi:hypothetical protein
MNYPRWIAHFEANRLNRPEPDWSAPFSMPESKRHLLAASMAEYQLGDGGGPCQLIARDAERFQGTSEDVRRVVELWFAEEKEHSRLLAGAVRRVRGEFVGSTFAFTLFCQMRRWMSVQFELLVLLLVEIVSTGYYRLIRRHVGDKPIADMCRLILRDEARHVEFHRERLSTEYPNGVSWFWRTRFRALSYACVAFLWLGHGRCLRALGASRAELFAQVARGTERFLRALPQSQRTESHAQNAAVFPNPGMQG